ncbi:hypothetical protein RHSIM_Rhsim10G0135500 [Rhododendron simsii]|uniref:Uncharacterized protein n=1 Tax=Rhododendron simsii TaxID=118357 RepID=A0A834GFJ3_RHOSS|nr:hypothetical protein RHSIM_Rhsim10G0135500 [Rhododendron simsii]
MAISFLFALSQLLCGIFVCLSASFLDLLDLLGMKSLGALLMGVFDLIVENVRACLSGWRNVEWTRENVRILEVADACTKSTAEHPCLVDRPGLLPSREISHTDSDDSFVVVTDTVDSVIVVDNSATGFKMELTLAGLDKS